MWLLRDYGQDVRLSRLNKKHHFGGRVWTPSPGWVARKRVTLLFLAWRSRKSFWKSSWSSDASSHQPPDMDFWLFFHLPTIWTVATWLGLSFSTHLWETRSGGSRLLRLSSILCWYSAMAYMTRNLSLGWLWLGLGNEGCTPSCAVANLVYFRIRHAQDLDSVLCMPKGCLEFFEFSPHGDKGRTRGMHVLLSFYWQEDHEIYELTLGL